MFVEENNCFLLLLDVDVFVLFFDEVLIVWVC